MLSVILAFSTVDRIALGLLLQNVKVSLGLSDVQLGFLNGIAFAIFYSIMGIPLSRWADRGNRALVIASTTALWGVMVSTCGAAASFTQLLLVRIGVAVGEAGAMPASFSLLSDYFGRAERPRAFAIYFTLSTLISSAVGDLLAGWLNQWFGWRDTFILIGLPGLLLGVLSWKTLREPRRTEHLDALAQCNTLAYGARAGEATHASQALGEAVRLLWRNKTYRHLVISFSIFSFFAYGLAQWQPSFFVRSFRLHSGLLGNWFALIHSCSCFGLYFGGEFATRLARNDERLQLVVAAVLYALFGLVCIPIYLSPIYQVSFALIALSAASASLVSAPLIAMVQTLAAPEVRALSITLLYLAGNLIGMGLGPLAIGALSQTLHHHLGADSLRYALLLTCPGYLWGSYHFLLASRSVTKDLHTAQAISPAKPY